MYTCLLYTSNINKGRRYNPIGIRKAIEQVLKENHLDNCKATICDALAIRYCESNDISYMVRGLRNNVDYNYEENIAKVNHTINPGVETLYFRTSEEAISSSTVYELYKYLSLIHIFSVHFLDRPVLYPSFSLFLP